MWFTGATMAEKPKGSVAVGLVMFLAIVGSCVALWPEPRERTEAEKAADKLLNAMIRCENETEARLADADGFDAQPFGEWLALPGGGDNRMTFSYRAKAKNGFGALVWAEFTCQVTHDGEYWSVDELTVR